MSFNATRLTCFALISAFETDCRDAILLLDADNDIQWPQTVRQAAAARLQRERKNTGDEIESLVQYLDFADSSQVLLANRGKLSASLRASLESVAPKLEQLTQIRNRVAHSRPMEIGDLALTSDVAEHLATDDRANWPQTAATLDRLRLDPSFVLGLTVELPSDPIISPQHNLPIPDFDETGFFGRSTELKRVKKALLGAYPVVSILGDGGIGKTAIALKVAYDLLDSSNSPFEAIVWASAKTTSLTNSEIIEINGAIQDSLGLFEAAAHELVGDSTAADPIADVLEYLEHFRVLLILDNLETVTDKRLRDFLLDLPVGSKVLLTSRIGLGIENPVKLEPLSKDESKRLLKALASIRGVEVLRRLDDTSLGRLADKLRGHPLYIKWLVAGVQAGRRPSDLVNDNGLLLDFCMSNVWDKLSSPAKIVLQAMQIARNKRNLSELAYLTEFGADQIQSAVLELMTTNFVSMRYSAEDGLDGAFETGEFASQYLSRHQPPSPAIRARVSQRSRALEDLGRTLVAESRANPFDPFTIDIRDSADVPTARLLRAAIQNLRTGDLDLALEVCGEAQVLSPAYGETWRIQGLVNTYRNDIGAAEQDYQRALEYADKSAATRYHAAEFFLETAQDLSRALEVINSGLQVNPSSPSLLYMFARINFAAEKYVDAIGACSVLAGTPQVVIPMIGVATLCLRASVFGAEQLLWKGNIGATAELLEEALRALDRITAADMDERSADWLVRLHVLAARLRGEAASEEYLARRAREFEARFEQKVRTIDPTLLSRRTGQIKSLDDTKRFAFIRSEEQDVFFHRNDLITRDEWQILSVNSLVAFDFENAARGPRAGRVRALT